MRLRTKILSIVCGTALVATVMALSYDAVSAPADATQPTDQSAVPQAQVDGVAAALGISRDEARTRLVRQEEAHQVYKRLPESLVKTLAGHWFDAKTGKLTVAVTTKAAAAKARAAGAEAKVVSRDRKSVV